MMTMFNNMRWYFYHLIFVAICLATFVTYVSADEGDGPGYECGQDQGLEATDVHQNTNGPLVSTDDTAAKQPDSVHTEETQE